MHLVKFLKNAVPDDSPPVLRGYEPQTWVSPELRFEGLSLSVNQLTYSPCRTFRDLYFEHVEGIPRPPTWQRVVGRAVDTLYARVHDAARTYCDGVRARDFDLIAHLGAAAQALVDDVLTKELRGMDKIQPQPPTVNDQDKLRASLLKIVRFEARLIGSFIEQEIARSPTQRPREIFNRDFDFNTQFNIASLKHGFSTPATPDFLYKQTVLGDIKVGEWKEFYEYTMVAYALAFEEEHHENIDEAAILLVQLPASRPFPTHEGSRREFLSDAKRKRFLLVRDRKLQIIAERIDPGRAGDQGECAEACPYWNRCWGDTTDG